MHTITGTLGLEVTKDSNTTSHAYSISQSKAKFQHLGDMVVAEAASDQEFDFSSFMTSVEELWIISDKEITVKLNADSNLAMVGKKFLFSELNMTLIKVFISNSSGEDATIQMIIGG